MLGGFNTNVPYKGEIFHVQTEDGGTKNPQLITHLYIKGAILISEKFNYAELLIEEDWREKVLEAMKTQHKRVIKDLLAGKYSGESAREETETGDITEAGETPGMDMTDKPLFDKVLEYILPPEGR
jgi:hypothetical protein